MLCRQRFVADSILQGFDLNKPAQTEGYDGVDQDGNDTENFVPGPHSTTTAGASNVAEEDGEEICSQPVVPFVGMIFDDLEVAKQVYNDYAWKLGFGTHIGNTKYITTREVPNDTILSRVFECVHTGKPAAECKNTAARSKEAAAKVKEASVDMSNIGEQKSRSKQAGSEMDVNESKQRCALLPDETTETFKWVFERWMLAVNQMHPDHIMTDQDQAMATAIDKQYELCQNLMLDREDNAGFTMETTTTKLWGSYSIEEHALKFYTREVFDRFQKMVQSSTRFYPIHVEAEGLCFDLVPNQDLDVKTYRVAVNPEEGWYTCGCNMFEMCGLICPHIIRVMVHLNVQQIPGRYMLERWSAAATTHAPEPRTNTIRFGVPTTNTLKYNSLCRKMNQLASDACFDDDTSVAVSRIVDGANKVINTMLKAKGQVQQEGEGYQHRQGENQRQQKSEAPQQHQQTIAVDGTTSQQVKNPPRTKPKGRPKITEKRRKTLVELWDEANEKRMKKQSEPKTPKDPKPKRKYRKKMCPFCGDEDHISVKECKYMKIALAREDAMQAGADLTL
nr:protein FAR1-RELATED SEQUENCE 4-like [Lolium perenne]